MDQITGANPDTQTQRYVLQGAVDLHTFREQRAAGEAAIRAAAQLPQKSVVVDFREVEAANSLGVALMTAWFRLAESLDCNLQIAPLPHGLQLIVDFSGLGDVLPLTPSA